MEQYTLDTALLRLKDITEQLEKNELDMDLSMKLYEEGVHLISFCNAVLTGVKQKIVALGDLQTEENGDV